MTTAYTGSKQPILFFCLLLVGASYCYGATRHLDPVTGLLDNDSRLFIANNRVLNTFYRILLDRSLHGRSKSFIHNAIKDASHVGRRGRRSVADEIISGVYSRSKRAMERQKILNMLVRLTQSMPSSCSKCDEGSHSPTSRAVCSIEHLLRHNKNSCPNGDCIDKVCSKASKQMLLKDLKAEIYRLQRSILMHAYRRKMNHVKAMRMMRRRRLNPHSLFDGKQLISYK